MLLHGISPDKLLQVVFFNFFLIGKPISSGICFAYPKQAQSTEQLALVTNGRTRCLSPVPGGGRSEVTAVLCSLVSAREAGGGGCLLLWTCLYL